MAATDIYSGTRGDSFISFLRSMLRRGKLAEKYIGLLLDEKGLEVYDQVFTSSTVDPQRNYEFFEFMGDTTVNKSITWYLPKRYPRMDQQTTAVGILTRLKLNLVSDMYLSGFADKLGFFPFISSSEKKRTTDKLKLLEDVFEAFVGATEWQLDNRVFPFCGYSICYTFVESILDEFPFSLKYEDLFDPITRLKEIVDKSKGDLSGLKYEDRSRHDQDGKMVFEARAVMTIRHDDRDKRTGQWFQVKRTYTIGTGTGFKKKYAMQGAAEQGVSYLRRYFPRFIPVYPDLEKMYGN